ncbi:MAG: hypothetical protein RR162_00395 [Oscillospiraceae bacterium]
MERGIETLRACVKKDCEEGGGSLHEEGCCRVSVETRDIQGNLCYKQEGNCGKCFHNYCDKFKWVVERAKHYEEKLGIPWEEVLSSWEKDRSYWYMNYYQDGNQPLIEGEHVRVFDTLEEFLSSVSDKRFRCPACGGISSNPYECNSGLVTGKGKSAKPCNWKVYGLFGDMGKGCYVYIKDKVKGERIFMPVSWEINEKSEEEKL